MFQGPNDPIILNELRELRLWLDGFMTDRAEDNNMGETWPYAITGTHVEALETTIHWLEEYQHDQNKFERKGDPKDDI